jgi:hypothetical protein
MIADWQLEMAARPAPPVRQIVAGSTPVLSFGHLLRAEVLTVGINPSSAEFRDRRGLLAGGRRRLATMDSIGATPGGPLTAEQARSVVANCDSYFVRRPYRRWFTPLEQLLDAAVGASYYAGTACHIDLVQWATDPVWSHLDSAAAKVLMEEGRPHLGRLLDESKPGLILLNGRTVCNQVERARLCRLRTVGDFKLRATTCLIFLGRDETTTFVGWSANLQGNRRGEPLGDGLDADAVRGDPALGDQLVQGGEDGVAGVDLGRRAVQLDEVERVVAEVGTAAVGPAAEGLAGVGRGDTPG